MCTHADDLAAAALLAAGSHAGALPEQPDGHVQQRRFDSQSTSALDTAAARQLADVTAAHEPAAEPQQPKKRLGRRLTAQSLDGPLSRLAAGSGLPSGHTTPCDADASADARAALRQSMPGGFAQLDDRQAGGGGGDRVRLRPVREPNSSGGGGDMSLASRSVDSRAAGGGSVFALQLASLQASTPRGLQSLDNRQQQQQPRGPLKRHATTGNWVSALVPPAPTGSAEASPRMHHRWSEVRALLSTGSGASCGVAG